PPRRRGDPGTATPPAPRPTGEGTGRRGLTEVGYSASTGREAQFRVLDEVADERDLGFACHGTAAVRDRRIRHGGLLPRSSVPGTTKWDVQGRGVDDCRPHRSGRTRT